MVRRAGLFVLILAVWSSTASAREGHEEGNHYGAHHRDLPNLVGARVGYLSILEREEHGVAVLPGLLAGVSYERVVLHDWLEIELSVPIATFDDGEAPILVMPMDLHFKLPFHPSPYVSPYVAVGPAVDVKLRPETDVFFGASVAVGTYIWSSDQMGLDVEVDYNLVKEEALVHELLIALGPVLRF